jgi:glutaredoxin
MRRLIIWAFILLVLIGAAPVSSAAAQGCDECREIKKELRQAGFERPESDARPSPPAPLVRIVLYWLDGCGHCHEVIEGILPQMQQQYGAQLEVRLIEIVSMEDIAAFYTVAEQYGYTRGSAEVPFLMIGERSLVGMERITAELPNAIESYLAEGGIDWPAPRPTPAVQPTALPVEPTAVDASCGLALACTEPVADASAGVEPAGARTTGVAGTEKPWLAAGGAVGLLAATLLVYLGVRRLPGRGA